MDYEVVFKDYYVEVHGPEQMSYSLSFWTRD